MHPYYAYIVYGPIFFVVTLKESNDKRNALMQADKFDEYSQQLLDITLALRTDAAHETMAAEELARLALISAAVAYMAALASKDADLISANQESLASV